MIRIIKTVTYSKREVRELYMLGKIPGHIAKHFDMFSELKRLVIKTECVDGEIVDAVAIGVR